jgi:hypothetical protein
MSTTQIKSIWEVIDMKQKINECIKASTYEKLEERYERLREISFALIVSSGILCAAATYIITSVI